MDKAKDLPFLNKGSKSTSSASSDDSSSDSDSSESSSDAEPRRNSVKKTAVTATTTPTATPTKATKSALLGKQRKESVDKKGNSSAKSSNTASGPSVELPISSKGEESIRSPPSAAAATTPKSIGRGKRSSNSDGTAPGYQRGAADRRQSADNRSGNLAKGAKSIQSPTSKSAGKNVDSQSKRGADDKKGKNAASNASPVKIKSPEPASAKSTARKRKSSLLDDKHRQQQQEETSSSESRNETESKSATASSPLSSKVQSISAAKIKSPAGNRSAIEESGEPSKLSPKKRETNERLKSPESQRTVHSLEQEISERKAEHQSTNQSKLSRLSNTLDKLLGKREKEQQQKEQTCRENHSRSQDDISVPINRLDEDNKCPVDMEIEPKEPVESINEIIDVAEDKSSKYSTSSKTDSKSDSKHKQIDDKIAGTRPCDEVLAANNEMYAFENSSHEVNDKSILSQEQFVNNMPKPPSPKSSLIFSPPPTSLAIDKRDASIFDFGDNFPMPNDSSVSLLAFNAENLFKEDSAKETMDLVANLRQKIKKGSGKADDAKSNLDSINQAPVIEIDTSPDSTTMDKADVGEDSKLPAKSMETNKQANMQQATLVIDLDQENSSDESKPSETIAPANTQQMKPSVPDNWLSTQNQGNLMNANNLQSQMPLQTEIEQIASKMQASNEVIPTPTDILMANELNDQPKSNKFHRSYAHNGAMWTDPATGKIVSPNQTQGPLAHQQQQQQQQPAPQHVHKAKNDPIMTIRHRSETTGDLDENDSPYMRNKWSEQEMIQTRRSVSSSPSSESGDNDSHLPPNAPHMSPPQHNQQAHAQQLQTIAANLQAQATNQMGIPNAAAMRVSEMLLNENIPFENMQEMMQMWGDKIVTPNQQHQQQQQQQQHQFGHEAVSKDKKYGFTELPNRNHNFINFGNHDAPNAIPKGANAMQAQQQLHESSLNVAAHSALPKNEAAHSALPLNVASHPQQFNFPNENNQFSSSGPVSLFPPTTGINAPFPSPGAAMFPPTFTTPYTSASTNSQQSVSSHQQTCGAAFTSSSRNMALTAAMMAPSPVQTDIASPPNNLTPAPTHLSGANNNNNNNNNNHKLDQLQQQQQQHLNNEIMKNDKMVADHLQQHIAPNMNLMMSQQLHSANQHQTAQTQSFQSQQLSEPQHIPPMQAAHQYPQQPYSNQSLSAQVANHLPDNNFAAESVTADLQATAAAADTEKLPTPERSAAENSSKRPTRYNAQQAAQNITQQLNTMKSPSKSPGKSPRQMEILRQKSESTRGRPRGARNTNSARGAASRAATSSRGRGRGRTPAIIPMPNALYELNNHIAGTIHNKLQGTVYDLDFDEDFAENVENLKSMRDRRRSIDCRNQQSESFRSRDASESPKFASTANNQKLSRMVFGATDIRELRPPSPIAQDVNSAMPPLNIPAAAQQPMHTIEPVMPGPVDMRTYNSGFEATNNDVFNSSNMLGAFASGITDQTLPDIDEEFEKDFQSALKASNTKTSANANESGANLQESIANESESRIVTTHHVVEPVIVDPTISSLDHQLDEPPKHSLIKLKIKGPHARPENYTSSVITTYQSHNNTTIEQTIQGTPNSSFRRMRKKELLRQYWTQENMDDSNCAPQQEQAQNAASSTTNSGRSAGIPKAVDSMSSIPTKDDYKDYAALDIKKRKIPANRELRQLDVPSYDEVPERRRSICSNASNTSSSNAGESSKRKTRTKQAVMTTPKLKIKIGSDIIEPSGIGDSGSARPPKKRLANMTMPSLEELRRESMNYRKKVISQFNDDTVKPKKKDKSKREKGKHKKNKKEKDKDKDKEKKEKLEIVSNEMNSSKLIIRFAKRKAEAASDSAEEASTSGTKYSIKTNQGDANASLSTAPIRLKIARSSQGGGYVAEASASSTAAKDAATAKDSTDLVKCHVVLTDFTKNPNNEVKPKEDELNMQQLQQQHSEKSQNGDY